MNWKVKEFNELTTNELYKILKERINIFIVEQDCPYVECDDKDLESYHLYASQNDEIIAYARIISPGISYPEVSIGRVLVKEGYRGAGLGRKLMKKAINYIKEKFVGKNIRISAQEYLIAFYQSLGFEKVSDVYLEDEIPHVEMLKRMKE